MPTLDNHRWELFAQGLAAGKTAHQAYIDAGYEPNRHNAARLNTNETIHDRVQELLEAGAKKVGITVERIMEEYARIGFADIRRAVNWNAVSSLTGTEDEEGVPGLRTFNEVALVPSDEIDFDTARAIAEISQTDKGGLKVKFHDKKGALDSMARALGMFIDRTDVRMSPLEHLPDDELDRRLVAAAVAAGVSDQPTEH